MEPPLVVGNWKMHGTQKEAAVLAKKIRNGLKRIRVVDVALAPPFTALVAVRDAIKGSRIHLAGQNVHWEARGAFTGEVSVEMLRELDCDFALVGHSERRRLFNETDEAVAQKMLACLKSELRPILCIGETLEERENKMTAPVIERQLGVALKGLAKSAIPKITIAYEPVWAIGTGRNATPDQISHTHMWIRKILEEASGKKEARRCRILYGGSVRPDNAGELRKASEVNGVLVGGASLKAEDFLSIIQSFVAE